MGSIYHTGWIVLRVLFQVMGTAFSFHFFPIGRKQKQTLVVLHRHVHLWSAAVTLMTLVFPNDTILRLGLDDVNLVGASI